MVANEVLYNKNLSFKAKGMYAYLFSKPDEWDFSSNRMTMETTDRRDAIMGMLRELEENGYLIRKRLPNGKMEYTLKHSTLSLSRENQLGDRKPKSDLPTVGKSLCGKSSPISNTEEKVIQNTSDVPSQDVVSVIDSFEEVNSAYKKWYKNKTQREAIKRLIENHSLEKVLKVVKILPKTNLMQYIPSVTTPLELEDRWTKLETSLIKKKEEINHKKPTILI